MGRWILVAGIGLVVVGLVLTFAPGLLAWFGRLPGDIRIEGAHGRLYVPITSMLLVSVVLSVLLNLLGR